MQKIIMRRFLVLLIIVFFSMDSFSQVLEVVHADSNQRRSVIGIVVIDGKLPYAVSGTFEDGSTDDVPIYFYYVPGAFMISTADYERLYSYHPDSVIRICINHSEWIDFRKSEDVKYVGYVLAEVIQYGNFILNIRNFKKAKGTDYYFDFSSPSGIAVFPSGHFTKRKYEKVKSVFYPYYTRIGEKKKKIYR